MIMDGHIPPEPADADLSPITPVEETLHHVGCSEESVDTDSSSVAEPRMSSGDAVPADEAPDAGLVGATVSVMPFDPQGQVADEDDGVDHSRIAAFDAMFGGHGDPDYLETIAGMEAAAAEDAANALSMAAAVDPFARLSDSERAPAAQVQVGTGGEVPHDTLTQSATAEKDPPLQRFEYYKFGIPARAWLYRNAAGAVIGAAARYDRIEADGSAGKDVLPWTYGLRVWIDRRGKPRSEKKWHCKAPPSPRPLYGLDRLAARPDAPVLVCEGEKAADAASSIFADMVCVTSQGGSKAAGKADWAPLEGRSITVWPDRDQAGRDYAMRVATQLKAVAALSVRVVDVPMDWPRGWDLADPLPDGVDPGRLHKLLADAPSPFVGRTEVTASVSDGNAAASMPPGYRMTPRGLLFIPGGSEKNPEPEPIFIAAPFEVVGGTRSDIGQSWGVLFRWRDREGTPHRWAIPRRLIHCMGNEIAQEHEDAGLACGYDASAHVLLKQFISLVETPRLLRCVYRTGWHRGDAGPVFVLPGGEAYGPGAGDIVLQADHASAASAYREAGTLGAWQSNVAALAAGNDRLVLFISAAFAGPLLDVVGEPSGGLHLVGDSRTGKSTAAIMAASVWGKPTAEAQLRPWRGTANGLEGVAAETADTLLILDEMGQADGREVGDIVYMLANEAGKQRASKTGAARPRQSWRTLFLSTGEITLDQKMGEAGKKAMAGLEVRLVNLPADAGAGLGLFQNLHGRPGPAALAEELRDAARSHHGVAARPFLQRLAEDWANRPAELRETFAAMRTAFLGQHVPQGASGQVRSVAGRFAMIAAAGELAQDYEVVPWVSGEAMRAADACFEAWLGERGGAGSGEDAAAMAQVRAFLEAHGESRFTPLQTRAHGDEQAPPDVPRTIDRAGFRRRVKGADGERWEFLILPETWKNDVCKGLDSRRTADLLIKLGLMKGGGRHRSTPVSIPVEGKIRVYSVSGAILGHDRADGGNDAVR